MGLTFALAVLLAIIGEPFLGVLLLFTAIPTAVRYVRRELALGALLAEASRTEARMARIPLTDLRAE